MFNKKDFDKIKNKDTAPDGLMDGSLYVLALKAITTALEEFNMQDEDERMQCMMVIVNESSRYIQEENPEIMRVIEPLLNCVIALGFHATMLLNILEQKSPGFLEKYFQMIHEQLMPEIEERSKAMPYWED